MIDLCDLTQKHPADLTIPKDNETKLKGILYAHKVFINFIYVVSYCRKWGKNSWTNRTSGERKTETEIRISIDSEI